MIISAKRRVNTTDAPITSPSYPCIKYTDKFGTLETDLHLLLLGRCGSDATALSNLISTSDTDVHHTINHETLTNRSITRLILQATAGQADPLLFKYVADTHPRGHISSCLAISSAIGSVGHNC
jgi:hypothetical protein